MIHFTKTILLVAMLAYAVSGHILVKRQALAVDEITGQLPDPSGSVSNIQNALEGAAKNVGKGLEGAINQVEEIAADLQREISSLQNALSGIPQQLGVPEESIQEAVNGAVEGLPEIPEV